MNECNHSWTNTNPTKKYTYCSKCDKTYMDWVFEKELA